MSDTTRPAHSRLNAIAPAARPKMHGRAMIAGPSGAGKALRDDQPVLTPTGWVRIGSLAPGDVVYGVDGLPCTVTGVHPQGVRDLYEVETSDGVVIVADADHLWLTQTVDERGDKRPGKVRTTAQVAEKLRNKRGRAWHYLPMTAPVEHPHADLPVDPYVLGALIGDAGMSGRGVVLTCPDSEIVEAVGREFKLTNMKNDPIGWYVGGAIPLMRALGLMGCRSHEKRIPDAYMYASVSQRLALMQGLLDTDGSADGHACEFSTSSPHLAEQMGELVRSFGGTVTSKTKIPTFTYKGESRTGRLTWVMYVKLPRDIEPFRLSRKRLRYTPRTKYQPWRQIVDVRRVEPGHATCISVDSPDHLFLTAGHVPTHNTFTALSIASVLAEREGDAESILVIDTERESALTYADVFRFHHLPWRPPFDPTELTATLTELGDQFRVVVIDSLTHFWRGLGGTLDIADGKFGGWKGARPIQEAMVQAILAVPAHMIVTVRSKMEYTVAENGKQVSRVGMAPVQDDGLVYEMNVALDVDMEHRLTVTKSRTPAVPVGRMYPAGHERKAADDYAAWLAGGVPPASRDDVNRIIDAFAGVADAETRTEVKQEFVQRFGMPHTLTADNAPDAIAWVEATLAEPVAGGGDAVAGNIPEEAVESQPHRSDPPATED